MDDIFKIIIGFLGTILIFLKVVEQYIKTSQSIYYDKSTKIIPKEQPFIPLFLQRLVYFSILIYLIYKDFIFIIDFIKIFGIKWQMFITDWSFYIICWLVFGYYLIYSADKKEAKRIAHNKTVRKNNKRKNNNYE